MICVRYFSNVPNGLVDDERNEVRITGREREGEGEEKVGMGKTR